MIDVVVGFAGTRIDKAEQLMVAQVSAVRRGSMDCVARSVPSLTVALADLDSSHLSGAERSRGSVEQAAPEQAEADAVVQGLGSVKAW